MRSTPRGADPSQAQDDSQPVEDPKRTGRCAKLSRVRARWTGDQARRLRVSRSGRLATDQKAVHRRGPGRVVLGSKPQLATTEKLVSWAPTSTPTSTSGPVGDVPAPLVE